MSKRDGKPASGALRKLPVRYGPWAVVTGASDGIGRGVAEELARAGLNLVLVARREELLAALGQELSARHGVETKTMALDMSNAADLEALLQATRSLDVGLLVAAAGYGTSGRFIDADLSVESDMLDVNCRAVLALVHPFARRFVAQRRGGLVLFGSLVGWQGTPFAAHYAATKAYVQTLAEGLHVELAPFGVDVLAAAPGPVASGFARRADLRMNGATPAAVAARGIVRALGRRGTVVPGGLGKLLTYSLLPLPRRLRVRIMAQVMRGMTKHHGATDQAQAKSA